MAEFTVKELFDLLKSSKPRLRLRYEYQTWNLDEIEFSPHVPCVAGGKSPRELYDELKARAVPTAEEALEDLATLRCWPRIANVDNAMTRLERYVRYKGD